MLVFERLMLLLSTSVVPRSCRTSAVNFLTAFKLAQACGLGALKGLGIQLLRFVLTRLGHRFRSAPISSPPYAALQLRESSCLFSVHVKRDLVVIAEIVPVSWLASVWNLSQQN